MSETKLLPCPFCGGAGVLKAAGVHQACCADPECPSIQTYETHEEAVRVCNTRRTGAWPGVREQAIAFERATELAARQLASFRLGLDCDDPFAYTDNEKLIASHIVGNLWANGLLNDSGERWEPVNRRDQPLTAEEKP